MQIRIFMNMIAAQVKKPFHLLNTMASVLYISYISLYNLIVTLIRTSIDYVCFSFVFLSMLFLGDTYLLFLPVFFLLKKILLNSRPTSTKIEMRYHRDKQYFSFFHLWLSRVVLPLLFRVSSYGREVRILFFTAALRIGSNNREKKNYRIGLFLSLLRNKELQKV